MSDTNTTSSPIRVHPRSSAAIQLLTAIGLSGFFFLVYGFCANFTAARSDVSTHYFEWERMIPLIPWLVVPYWSLDAFFFIAPFLCNKRQLLIHALRIVTAIIVAGACFLLFPMKYAFPRPEVEGIFAPLFKLLWAMDMPYNLAPSLHLALRTIIWPVYIRKMRGATKMVFQTWFILIGVSTLFTYQHHLLDVITGQFLGIACLYFIPEYGQFADVGRQRNVRVGAMYGAAAVMAAVLAIVLWPWGALLTWPAVAMAIVTAGYLGVGGRIFHKTGGWLPHTTRWLLAPYLAPAWLIHRWFCRREPPPVEIAPGVFAGRRLGEREAKAFLQTHNVAAVLDLTAEFSDPPAFRSNPAIVYKNIALLDLAEPSPQHRAEAQAFIAEHRARGVYVHCALGRFRTPRMARLTPADEAAAMTSRQKYGEGS